MLGLALAIYFLLSFGCAFYFTKRLTVNDIGRRNPTPGAKEAALAALGVVIAKTIAVVLLALVLSPRWEPIRGLLAFGLGILLCGVVYTLVYQRTYRASLGLSTLVNVLLAVVYTGVALAMPGVFAG